MRNYTLSIFLFLSSVGFSQGQGCAPKMVLMEMACGKLCYPCFDHIEHMRDFYAMHKEHLAFVYYSQAPIGLGTISQPTQPYMGFHHTFNIDYQSSVLVDRTFMPNNYSTVEGTNTEVVGDVEEAYNTQMENAYVPVSVDIHHIYDPVTRQVSVDLTGTFCEAASGDMRFYLVVVQDSVKGEGEPYGQAVMSTEVANSFGYTDVQSTGNNMWINKFPHPQVVKYQPSGFFGNAGIIAASVNAGQSFTENYTFTLPEFGASSSTVPVDPEQVEIIAAVVYSGPFGERQVLNANKARLTDGIVGVTESERAVDFEIAGNPLTGNELVLNWKSEQSMTGDVLLYSADGRIIDCLENGLSIGITETTKSYEIGELPSGTYFVGYKTSGKQYTRKLLISK